MTVVTEKCIDYTGSYIHITGAVVQARELLIHPNFRSKTSDYYQTHDYNNYAFDYCLIRVDTIDFAGLNNGTPPGLRIGSTNLPDTNITFPPGIDIATSTKCMIAGWGKINSYGQQSPALREASVHVMSTKYCNNIAKTVSRKRQKEVFSRVTDDYSFCAGLQTGYNDTCQGDSGGPLYCKMNGKWVIYGITSHGADSRCGVAGRPGIYSKVSSIVPWIKQYTQSKSKSI